MEHINQVAFQDLEGTRAYGKCPKISFKISQSTDNQSCQQIGYAQTGGAVRNKMAKEFKKVDAYHLEEKKWNSGHEDFYASKCPLDQSKIHVIFLSIKLLKFIRIQYMRNSIFRFSSRLMLERPISKR